MADPERSTSPRRNVPAPGAPSPRPPGSPEDGTRRSLVLRPEAPGAGAAGGTAKPAVNPVRPRKVLAPPSGTTARSPLPAHAHPHTHPELAPPPPPRPGPIVTLTTDIGWSYAAQMKAVLLRAAPWARIVDITHQVESHSVLEGAFLLRFTGIHFPPGSIHVGIVDPGVGSSRQPLIVLCGDGSLLVGPDNGVLVPLAEALGEPKAYRIRKDRVALGMKVSPTFEGRDLFAPAAALLATGEAPEHLGERTEALRFHLPAPHLSGAEAEVTVLHVDVFGNVITNLPWEDLLAKVSAPGGHVRVEEGRQHFRASVVRTYSELDEGCLGAVGSSFGLTELAVHRGRADRVLGVRTGTRLHLRPHAVTSSTGEATP